MSLEYGVTGRDTCGARTVKIRDTAGNFVESEHFEFYYFSEEFEFIVNSYEGAGTNHTIDLVLSVSLEDYSGVPSSILPVTLQYREEIPLDPVVVVDPRNTTNSGFVVNTIDPNISYEPLIIIGYQSLSYTLPAVKNGLDEVVPVTIDLPDGLADFATFDPEKRLIFIDETLLEEKHEGTYNVTVELTIGYANFERKYRVPWQIIITDLKEPEPEEEPLPKPEPEPVIVVEVPEDLIVVTPPVFIFEPGKFSKFGDRVPDEEINALDKYETKDSLEVKEATGNEPKPSLRSVDESGLLTIDWDKMMQKPENLDLIKSSQFAVTDEDAPDGP